MGDNEDKRHLYLIPSEKEKEEKNKPSLDWDLDPEAIENLDVNKLKKSMLKGIYTLEFALFSQAGFEYERITKMREYLHTIEESLFNKEALSKLDSKTKAVVYSTFSKNMGCSLNFLQDLHKNVASGLDAVSHIEKEKASQGSTEIKSKDTTVSDAKKMILELIKKRVKE